MEITSEVLEIIKPSNPSPSPPASILLSSVDQIIPRKYTPFLLFFKQFIASSQLKLSLSRTLSLFYPLAGRYKVLPNQALQIQCCDSGIHFIEALASKSLEEEFGSFSEFNPSLDSLTSVAFFPAQEITEIPLVSIKLTRFLCGGAALQVAIHHSALDGVATADFLKAWALICAGQENLAKPPHLDRSLLLDTTPPKSTPEEFQIEQMPLPGKVARIILSFTSSGIRSLLPSEITATRFEILTAHLWIAITRARAALAILGSQEETKLVFVVDGRKRFDPPLPDGFLGNAIFTAIAVSTVEQLLMAGSIVRAVNLIQEAKRKITHQHMVSWISSRKCPLSIGRSDFVVSSWQRLEMSGVDFGSGKPAFVGSNGTLRPGVAGILPQIEGNDHLAVLTTLESDQVDPLLKDPGLRV